ncbi:MAG: hypothetical protein J1E64_05770 [Acetatifactor sp.]|nr:hypothetical protein [Acetatifactor sp.]
MGALYCYPEEAEKGWGAELSVIANTFAVIETLSSQGNATVRQTAKALSSYGLSVVTF